MGYSMSTAVEDDHLIFMKKLYSDDYLFVYVSDDNNVVVLIQTTPEIADTPYADITYQEVVDTMEDDIMEAME